MVTKSFIKAPSPATIPFWSYFLTILFISSIWLFNSLVATSYLEFIKIKLYLSLSNMLIILSDRPNSANFVVDKIKSIPFNDDNSLAKFVKSSIFRFLSTKMIWGLTILYFSFNNSFVLTLSK